MPVHGAVVQREAARVLLLDDADRVLLLQGRDATDPDAGTWWFTPGGGIDPGESAAEAARRELLEETGIALDALGPVVHTRTAAFAFEGRPYRQHEVFFLARLPAGAPVAPRLTAMERRSLLGERWWAIPELTTAQVTVYPADLAALLERLLADPPAGAAAASGTERA